MPNSTLAVAGMGCVGPLLEAKFGSQIGFIGFQSAEKKVAAGQGDTDPLKQVINVLWGAARTCLVRHPRAAVDSRDALRNPGMK